MLSSEVKKELIEKSKAVRLNAYVPYSQFKVGAAILASDGKIYTGCNVENISYGLTVCAERNAIFNMIANGVQKVVACTVSTENGTSPCK
eukprot:gene9388-1599_t